MKRLLFLFLAIICFCSSSVLGQTQQNEWHDVTYLEHMNFKMRVTPFERPIVIEWGQLPAGISSKEAKEKLECLSVSTYFSVLDLDYTTWKTYCTEEYVNILEMDEAEFDKKKKIDLRRDYPDYRFMHVFYWIDYLIEGKEYSLVVCNYNRTRVEEIPHPEDMQEYGKEHGLSGTLLIKEGGQWKNHYEKSVGYRGFKQFANLGELLKIEKTGFVINGVERSRVYAVIPSEELRRAVGRDTETNEPR